MVKLTEKDRRYICLACKQTKFPIDCERRTFLVPQNMLAEAEEDLNIKHIVRLYDFHIQSVIPNSIKLNKPFDPKIRLKSARPIIKEGSKIESIKEGDRYTIVSTETVLEVKEATSKNVKLKYIESLRSDIVTTREQIEKAISLGTWTEI